MHTTTSENKRPRGLTSGEVVERPWTQPSREEEHLVPNAREVWLIINMGKPKRSLKAALDSHQVKMLKNKQSKALESRKVAVLKKAGARPKPRPVIPYSTSDSILLVGEGVFCSSLP